MGLQKYRADKYGAVRDNGAVEAFANWMGGPTLAKVLHCPTPFGRRTVYVRGEPISWSALPAACSYKGRTVRGYLTYGEDGPVFHPFRDQYHLFLEPGDVVRYRNKYQQTFEATVVRVWEKSIITKRPEWYGEESLFSNDYETFEKIA